MLRHERRDISAAAQLVDKLLIEPRLVNLEVRISQSTVAIEPLDIIAFERRAFAPDVDCSCLLARGSRHDAHRRPTPENSKLASSHQKSGFFAPSALPDLNAPAWFKNGLTETSDNVSTREGFGLFIAVRACTEGFATSASTPVLQEPVHVDVGVDVREMGLVQEEVIHIVVSRVRIDTRCGACINRRRADTMMPHCPNPASAIRKSSSLRSVERVTSSPTPVTTSSSRTWSTCAP